MILPEAIPLSVGSTVVVQWEVGGPWAHRSVVGRDYHSHSNSSYTIRPTKTDHIVYRNSKHITATPMTTEQYLRDQITRHPADPVDEILQQYGKLAQENVTYNHDSQRREDRHMSNNNDTQHSNMQ